MESTSPAPLQEPLYNREDCAEKRRSNMAPELTMAFDSTFKATTRNGGSIQWDYLSIHAIRTRVNTIARKYGLSVRNRAEAPKPDMLPQYTEMIGDKLTAIAWENALCTNVDDPTDVLYSGVTRGDAVYTDDKAIARAAQAAAKSALIAVLQIAAGEEPDATVTPVNPNDDKRDNSTPPTTPQPTHTADSLFVKLTPEHIARFRELLTENGLQEGRELVLASNNKANRLELPLSPATVRVLMTKLKIEDTKINRFIDGLLNETKSPTVPEQIINERNAKLAFTRLFNALADPAKQTFLASIGLKEAHLAALNDAQAARYMNRLERFAAANGKRAITPPASTRNL